MTDLRQLIERQMDSAGNRLVLALEPLSEEEFFAANATGFSAAWTTGHLACVADLFSSWFNGQLLFSRDFHQVFNDTDAAEAGPVSKAVSSDVYPRPYLLLQFRLAVMKALDTLDAFDLARWDAPAPPDAPVGLRTGGEVWERLAVHADWHCGELAGSMPRFVGTYALNIVPHYFYRPRRG
jgi:hypothetical protein